MELRQLNYFLKAKELLNFTEAAKQLNISQSTLSQQIKQLEEEIKLPLFNRIGKRITLTEAGLLFSEYAFQSVSRASDGLTMMNDLNNLNVGVLSIGVTYGLRNLLTDALILFSDKFPAIKVSLIFGTSAELIDKSNRTDLDFLLTFRDENDGAHIEYKSLFFSAMCLVVSKYSILSGRSSITLKEIQELPLALPDSRFNTIQFINKIVRTENFKLNASVETNDIYTLLKLVKTGRWNTILTEISVDDKDLVTIPIDGEDMLREATVISLKDTYKKKSAIAFQDYLRFRR